MTKCYICSNRLTKKRIDIARYWGNELVALHDVPVLVCTHCGNRYFEAKVSAKVDQRIKQILTKKDRLQKISVPVMQF